MRAIGVEAKCADASWLQIATDLNSTASPFLRIEQSDQGTTALRGSPFIRFYFERRIHMSNIHRVSKNAMPNPWSGCFTQGQQFPNFRPPFMILSHGIHEGEKITY